MAAPQATPEEPKKKNYLLWGCLIILVLMCLVIGCLVTVAGLSIGGIDPLGLNLDHQIDMLKPWQDYFEEPYSDPTYEDKDITPDDELEESSLDSAPESGSSHLLPFQSDNFTINFYYPAEWDIDEQPSSEGVIFYDLDNSSYLSVGRDWLCQGCATAGDTSTHFMETIQFQAPPESFEVIQTRPYSVSTGEDAHYGVYQWKDFAGNDHWAFNVNIYVEDPTEDTNIYFIMWGDDPELFESYGELLAQVVASYSP